MGETRLRDAPRTQASVWPVRLVFLMEAVVIGAWLPRIPDIKLALDLGAGELGLALTGMPAGSLIGFMVAPRFAAVLGLRRACMFAGALFALSFMPLAFAGSGVLLFAVLALCGLTVALVEVAMNSKAGEVEAVTGKRVMSQCHGFWSIGAVVGALLGGAIAQAGISPAMQFLVLNPVLAAVAFGVAVAMSPDATLTGESTVGFIVLPPLALVPLCLLPVGIMGLEGAVIDWSAIFVREVLEGEPIAAASAFAAFSTMMAIMRLTGDALAERFGARRVVLAAALAAAGGVALFAVSPNLPVLLIAATMMGAGCGPVYPLAMSAAAAAPGRSAEANVAAMSFIAFAVFLAGPPLMGGLTELFDLRTAFAILVPAALASAALSGTLKFHDDRARR